LNGFAESLAQRDAMLQQMAQGVSQVSQGMSDAVGQLAASTATTLAQRDAAHAAAMQNFANALAQRDVLHQQTAQTAAQLAQGVGDTFGNVATALAAGFTQLLERINDLEARVAELQAQAQKKK
jgi:leucyl aminopeptidase (aminopeptidase T)